MYKAMNFIKISNRVFVLKNNNWIGFQNHLIDVDSSNFQLMETCIEIPVMGLHKHKVLQTSGFIVWPETEE